MTNHAVSIVIPTFNGRHLLQRHLPHVLNASRHGDEVIVVDDASSDDTISWLKLEFNLKAITEIPPLTSLPKNYTPVADSVGTAWYGKSKTNKGWTRIVLVVLNKNKRFAAAANIGVALASHPLVFLLNNDVSPSPTVLSHLIPYFNDSSVFGVGCHEYEVQQLNPDWLDENKVMGEKLLDLKGAVESGKNVLFFDKGLYSHAKAPSLTTGTTGWVSGGSGLFSREIWLLLLGFDERFYPAYWEDIDLSFRARQMGYGVLFDEQAVVFHQHETTNSTVFGVAAIENISWKNASKFILKNGSMVQKLLHYSWMPYWLWKRARHAKSI